MNVGELLSVLSNEHLKSTTRELAEIVLVQFLNGLKKED